jgi:hypothetical protein
MIPPIGPIGKSRHLGALGAAIGQRGRLFLSINNAAEIAELTRRAHALTAQALELLNEPPPDTFLGRPKPPPVGSVVIRRRIFMIWAAEPPKPRSVTL